MKSEPDFFEEKAQKEPENAQGHPKHTTNSNKKWHSEWREKWVKMSASNKCMVFFTGVIAICTLIYAVVSAFQLHALIRSNAINQSALVDVQRALISFSHFEYMRIQDPDHTDIHSWKITARFNNEGPTTAKNTIGSIGFNQLPMEPTEEEFRGKYTKFPVADIGPKASQGIATDMIPEPFIFGIDLGKVISLDLANRTHFNRNLFIWVWIRYRDVFSNTEPHVTEFCAKLSSINLMPERPAGSNLVFGDNLCAIHNCQDEGCTDYKEIVSLDNTPN